MDPCFLCNPRREEESVLTALRIPRCKHLHCHKLHESFLSFRHAYPPSRVFRKERGGRGAKEKEKPIGRSTVNEKKRGRAAATAEKDEEEDSLFALSMTELIETTRSGTRFSIFKGASSRAFLGYFCRRWRR